MIDGKTILVTGGAGFVGSSLAVSFKNKYPSSRLFALDNMRRRGSELNLSRLRENGVKFVHGDIRNSEDLKFEFKIDVLLECSAEPSVLAGYGESPAYLINTNLFGTVNCLELARKNGADIIFLSTSRVYPYDRINGLKLVEKETRFEWAETHSSIPGWSQEGIDIDFSLEGPRSMYGATKLCSELILQEYVSMYGLRAVVNRCAVIAGPWQFGKVDQGVFTHWLLAHFFKKPLEYIGFGGRGKQVRDLLHTDDLFDLIQLQLLSMERVSGKTFNVGGGRDVSLSLREATDLCSHITGNKIKIGSEPQTRPADIAIYLTDNRLANEALGWTPRRQADRILDDAWSWAKENEASLRSLWKPNGA